jgi:integrase
MSGPEPLRSFIEVPVAPPRRRQPTSTTPHKIALPEPPRRAPAPLLSWAEISAWAPRLAQTMTDYLAQIAISSRPGTVSAADLALRTFAEHLAVTHPTCRSVKAIERHHIESFKIALAKRQGQTGPVTNATIRHKLGMLRTFFERLDEWDVADAPRKVPIFAGDIPKADEPLPRFLDDPTYMKFMATLARDTDIRRRLLVELLARTGMRAGELAGLRDDAVFRLGNEYWLRIPVGKLHNDRTVPLQPLLVELIEEYQRRRGPSPSGILLLRNDGQPFERRTVHRYVASVAKRAGVGHVHPHQLRHTLATHCINRGMSLEAIAALLGHRSPRMTLVYARISNASVAEQYFKAIEAVERAGAVVPRDDDVDDDRSRRELANGRCRRPALLDCSYQTICEGCGFFETGPEFAPILARQHDDALDKADFERARIFKELIEGLSEE